MIQMAQSPACGNAAALLIQPRQGSEQWVLLRKSSNTFAGYNDPNAVTVALFRDDEATQVMDFEGLTNGVPAWYRVYCDDGVTWTASGHAVSVTPAYQSQPNFHSPDVAATIRYRLELGLANELALGNLSHEANAIPVLSAPPLVDTVRFPVVTVNLESRSSMERGIGEQVIEDYFARAEDVWNSFEGWLDQSTVRITGWTLNPDDRIRLRDAIQRLLMLNLPVFDAAGFFRIDITQHDTADFESFNAPMYQCVMDFTCIHPALVREQTPPIRHIEVYPYAQADE